jgi:hypothetical protein
MTTTTEEVIFETTFKVKKSRIKQFVNNILIRGPILFLCFTMVLHVVTGGSFTIGTHLLELHEAIILGTLGIITAIVSFLLD